MLDISEIGWYESYLDHLPQNLQILKLPESYEESLHHLPRNLRTLYWGGSDLSFENIPPLLEVRTHLTDQRYLASKMFGFCPKEQFLK